MTKSKRNERKNAHTLRGTRACKTTYTPYSRFNRSNKYHPPNDAYQMQSPKRRYRYRDCREIAAIIRVLTRSIVPIVFTCAPLIELISTTA